LLFLQLLYNIMMGITVRFCIIYYLFLLFLIKHLKEAVHIKVELV